MKRLGKKIRRIARQEARRAAAPPERFRITRVSPLRLQSLHDRRIVVNEGDSDFSFTNDVAATAKVGSTALTIRDRTGDRVAIGVLGRTPPQVVGDGVVLGG